MVEPVYKSRKSKTSPLYQSISDHFSEFESVYEERYQKRYGVLRDAVREVVHKYLGCGDLRKGFARIKCKSCHHEVLLAFSCKGRYFCPSCHQKRVFSQEKMTYQQDSQTVLYRSKMNPNLRRNFAVFPVLDWILAITAHIPNKGEQLVRYYGYYSNVSRGKRKKVGEQGQEIIEIDPQPVSKELKKRWSYFIRKVYEIDPLHMPQMPGRDENHQLH